MDGGVTSARNSEKFCGSQENSLFSVNTQVQQEETRRMMYEQDVIDGFR